MGACHSAVTRASPKIAKAMFSLFECCGQLGFIFGAHVSAVAAPRWRQVAEMKSQIKVKEVNACRGSMGRSYDAIME